MLSVLRRLVGSEEHDGADAAPEPVVAFAPVARAATGSPAVPAIIPAIVDGGVAPGVRRDRAVSGGEDMVTAVLAQKVLHGWLQNRHQTLYPLTVNLKTVPPEHARLLASIMALAALAGRSAHDGIQTAQVVAWLQSVGAGPEVVAAFGSDLRDPPPLSRVLDEVAAAKISVFAYVAAFVALDQRDAAATRFIAYLADWLNLPATVIRSAERRYRR